MKPETPQQKAAKPGKVWQPIQLLDLIRYDPPETFFARLHAAGKLIRQSLKSDVFSIAKLRLADFEKNEREAMDTLNAAKQRPDDLWRWHSGQIRDASPPFKTPGGNFKNDLDSTRRILTLPPRFFTLWHGK